MFFKKKKEKELIEQPLNFWEEKSCFLIVPKDPKNIDLLGFGDKISSIDNIKIKEKEDFSLNKPGKFLVDYYGETYEIGYLLNEFSVPDLYLNNNGYYLKEEEKNEIKNSSTALTMFMEFGKDAKKSYHLQLKVALAMVPDLIGILDESAERVLPASWVSLAANSKVLPSPTSLYTVQAIYEKTGEVWIHTHGLCRCGLTELEILNSNKEYYNAHYNLISTYASYIIDKGPEYEPEKSLAHIGMISSGEPIVLTCVHWTKALKWYKNMKLGGITDREGDQGHNTKTSIIYAVKSEEDAKNGVLTDISVFNQEMGKNPILFFSDSETKRMQELAIERFDYLKKAFENKENKINLKIKISSEKGSEHIWFELIELKEDKVRVKLLQEPYAVDDLNVGDEKTFEIQEITDWIIYTPEFNITPDNVYLMK